MKRLNHKSLVEDAVTELEKFAPKNSAIEVDIKEEGGHYFTKIKLRTKNKTYFAKKEDLFFYKSFSKALKAIKVQLNKTHSLKQNSRQSIHLNFA